MTTKATFTTTPIAVIPDGWEKDWTVVLRVPASEWEKMKWLDSIPKTSTISVQVRYRENE